MSFTGRLFRMKDPFDLAGSERLFLNAVRENCGFQYRNCPEYRKILDGEGFHPEHVRVVNVEK